MNTHQYYLYLIKHRTLLLLFFLLFVLLSIPFIAGNQTMKYKTYLFFTVAPKEQTFSYDTQPSINSFFLVSAADVFAETIIGWFKNPSFMDDIAQKSGHPLPAINTRKETKQNVMIFFTTSDEDANNKISQAVIQNIQQSVTSYNQATNTTFSLTNLSQKTYAYPPSLWMDTLIGITVSFLLALLLITLPLMFRPSSAH